MQHGVARDSPFAAPPSPPPPPPPPAPPPAAARKRQRLCESPARHASNCGRRGRAARRHTVHKPQRSAQPKAPKRHQIHPIVEQMEVPRSAATAKRSQTRAGDSRGGVPTLAGAELQRAPQLEDSYRWQLARHRDSDSPPPPAPPAAAAHQGRAIRKAGQQPQSESHRWELVSTGASRGSRGAAASGARRGVGEASVVRIRARGTGIPTQHHIGLGPAASGTRRGVPSGRGVGSADRVQRSRTEQHSPPAAD